MSDLYLSRVSRPPLLPEELAALRARRVALNVEARICRQSINAIPSLAAKWWARAWRSCLQSHHRASLRRVERELAEIESRIGPPPRVWAVRPFWSFGRVYARYLRADSVAATAEMFPEQA